ncbi:hypothetical protein B296_00030169 [Ensete ventricosum]|uniref:Uncharacterized protein n=1 Tax=Ensete ventricosum TaxID=4639 RepID=A0A426WXL6_ENSVE|nr:hypothetical protein B296_00030169 [Ensete ventricosum]
MYRVNAVRNSPGVCRKLVEGIESLPGWHKGVHQKKTETHRKIVKDSRKCLSGIMRWDLVGSSLGDLPKESKARCECEGRLSGRRPEDLP